MTVDGRALVDIDKRMPTSMVGDDGKVLTVAGDVYEHAPAAGKLVGEIIMWPLNTPPSGYLTCRNSAADTTEYLTTTYPDLGALLESALPGPSGAGYFQTPAILFPKNSAGVGTLTVEAAAVGTHGHTAQAISDHTHTGTASSSGNHTHTMGELEGGNFSTGGSSLYIKPSNATLSTGSAGAHTHTVTVAAGGGHTPVINNHTGTNQPGCTGIHFCIKT